MSEEAQSDKAFADGKNEGVDRILQMFVSIANDNMVETGITLNVGCCLVSGTMIGFKKYLEILFSDFAGGFRAEGLAEIADAVEERARKALQDIETEQDAKSSKPRYIHLKDARFFFGNEAVPHNRKVLWRGKLSAVEGFTIGVMSVS